MTLRQTGHTRDSPQVTVRAEVEFLLPIFLKVLGSPRGEEAGQSFPCPLPPVRPGLCQAQQPELRVGPGPPPMKLCNRGEALDLL